MPYLEYIDDETFKKLVKNVLDVGIKKKSDVNKDFQKNVIDPFSSVIETAISNVNHKTWKVSEMARQCQKTLTNHTGALHQKILGNVKGWQDLGTGGIVDLVCEDRKIIAEVKNKHNTVTGGKLADQYHSLDRLVSPKSSKYKDYTAYFVNIIPKKPERFDITFEPSDKDKGQKCSKDEKIRITDGASFYELVTDRKDALEEMYNALPEVIEEIFRKEYKKKDFSVLDKDKFKEYFRTAYK